MRKVSVSIVIPYYNSEDTILRTLNSVKVQTFKDYEVILIDDGSTDSSHRLVDDFIKDNLNIKIINIYKENGGPSIARNIGIEKSMGKYIAFLDSDDEWLPEKLSLQISIMELNNIDMLGCNYYIIKNKNKSKFIFTHKKLEKIKFKSLLFKHYFATPCVIVKKEAIVEVGLFPFNQNYMEDAYVFASISRKYNSYMSNDFLLNIYKLPYGETGLSNNLDAMEKYELFNLKKFREDNNSYDEKISLLLYTGAVIFSFLKYLRRKAIVGFRSR